MRIENNYGSGSEQIQRDRRDRTRSDRERTADYARRIEKFQRSMSNEYANQDESSDSGGPERQAQSRGSKELPSMASLFSSLSQGYARGAAGRQGMDNNMEQDPSGIMDLSAYVTAGAQGGEGGVQALQSQAGVSSADEMLDLAENLTQRILVSKPDLAGDAERRVMITVNPQVLPNTEIMLHRDLNGMLFVSIVSSDPLAYKKLLETQQHLEKSLDKHEKAAFRVEVTYNGAGSEVGAGDAILPDPVQQDYHLRNG